MARTHVPLKAPQKSPKETAVGLPDKIQDAQLNLDFRYARNNILVLVVLCNIWNRLIL